MKIVVRWDNPWVKVAVYYLAIMLLLLSFGGPLIYFIYQNK